MTSADDRDNTADRSPGLAESAVALLTREAARMPLVALSLGLQAWERTRPVRQLALRRGNEALQIAAHTPLGRFLPQPVLDDDAQAEAEDIAASAARATAAARRTIAQAADDADAEHDTTAAPARPSTGTTSPSGGAAATTTRSSKRPAAKTAAAMAAGAPGTATKKVEQVTEQLDLDTPTSRDELPIPDFDNISIGSLRARLRSLSLTQLVTLREWEQAHANRLPVVTLLDNRIAKVAATEQTDTSAYPSGSGAATTAKRAAREQGGTLRV